MNTILFALWFFLPAGAANAAPIIAAKMPILKRYNAPVDGGKKYNGKTIFGPHKTWRGFASGICVAICVVYLQQIVYQNNNLSFLDSNRSSYLDLSPFLLGFLFGFGALFGDAIESMMKRQSNIKPGAPWFPFDQIDYILGGCIFVAAVARLAALDYVAILATWFTLHLFFSYVGYLLKLKESPI